MRLSQLYSLPMVPTKVDKLIILLLYLISYSMCGCVIIIYHKASNLLSTFYNGYLGINYLPQRFNFIDTLYVHIERLPGRIKAFPKGGLV